MSANVCLYKDLQFGRVFVLPAGTRQIEFKFPTTTGEVGRVDVDFGDVSEIRVLQRQLRNAGFGGAALTRADAIALDELVVRYAQSAKGRKALTPVYSSGGWNSRQSSFVLGEIELPAGREAPRSSRGGRPIHSLKGTMVGWKSSVAKLAGCSSRAMLLISAAFAAPTLALAGVEAGGFGFNLWGASSTGKTTALRASASVLAADFAASWNSTALGLQDLAQDYCDLPLTVDSMESVADQMQDGLTESVAYALANGHTRIRAKAWSASKGLDDSPWRTVLISTSEAKHRRAKRAGAAVRLVDVPVNSDLQSPVGIVDYFPADLPVERRAEFAASVIERLSNGITKHHGHALPILLSYLAKNTAVARSSLIAGRSEFLNRFGAEGLTNTDMRILAHFGLTYAAGRLGIELGILPWTETHLFDAIRRCATDALDNSTDREKQASENAARVVAWLAHPTRRVVEYSPGLTRSEIASADALSAEVAGPEAGEQDYSPSKLVLRQVLQRALRLTGKDIARAMAVLRHDGRLLTESRDDTLTVQYKFRDFSARFYVLHD